MINLLGTISSLLNYPRVLLNPILPPLRPLERALLSKLGTLLDTTLSQIVVSQMEEINFSQLVATAKSEINFMKLTPLGVDLSRRALFPFEGTDVKLAEMAFKCGQEHVKAIFWITRGKLFSIEFNRDISALRGRADPDVTTFKQLSFGERASG